MLAFFDSTFIVDDDDGVVVFLEGWGFLFVCLVGFMFVWVFVLILL